MQCFAPDFSTAPLAFFYSNPDHEPYPRSPRDFGAESRVGTTHLYGLPLPPPPQDYPDQIRNDRIVPASSLRGDWREGPHFKACAAAFADKFAAFASS